MKRWLLAICIVFLMLSFSGCAPRVAPVDTNPPPESEVKAPEPISIVQPPEGSYPATNLYFESQCNNSGEMTVLFSWTPSVPLGDAVVIDASEIDNNFAEGTYSSVRKLSPDRMSYKYVGRIMKPGIVFKWRVRTRFGNDWWVSETATSTTASC